MANAFWERLWSREVRVGSRHVYLPTHLRLIRDGQGHEEYLVKEGNHLVVFRYGMSVELKLNRGRELPTRASGCGGFATTPDSDSKGIPLLSHPTPVDLVRIKPARLCCTQPVFAMADTCGAGLQWFPPAAACSLRVCASFDLAVT